MYDKWPLHSVHTPYFYRIELKLKQFYCYINQHLCYMRWVMSAIQIMGNNFTQRAIETVRNSRCYVTRSLTNAEAKISKAGATSGHFACNHIAHWVTLQKVDFTGWLTAKLIASLFRLWLGKNYRIKGLWGVNDKTRLTRLTIDQVKIQQTDLQNSKMRSQRRLIRYVFSASLNIAWNKQF